jgi:hypothetical protein
MSIKAARYLTSVLLATLIAGCGLQDYENRMRATQERVSKYNDETDALGEPVTIPTKLVVIGGTTADPKAAKPGAKDQKTGSTTAKDSKTPPAKEQKSTTPTTERKKIISYTLFLRLPKGIRPTPDPDPRFEQTYHYPRSSPTSGVADVYLAFGSDPQANFADKVARYFPRNGEPITARAVDVPVLGREQPLNFDVREFNDAQSTWSVYSHGEGSSTLAIVFRVDKSQKAAATPAVDLSLSTLAMGSEADAVIASLGERQRVSKR